VLPMVMEADFIAVTYPIEDVNDSEVLRADSESLSGGRERTDMPSVVSKDSRSISGRLSLHR
jgi:hypothetical protein